ncbi:MAG: carbamoyl phosphate synthase small subunit [Clostridia bacterium]|nr:carbamoyl phosphate synthase small subunit [Clostridia bacterium]
MAYLVLSNGQVFEGTRIGAARDSIGELVFTTSMVGYLETLTDPAYAGQIVMQTFPLIGNYGVIEEDFEGDCALNGYIARSVCDTPSNFRSQYALERFLREHDVPGICGVDTRELTRILREQGTMNAMICDEIPASLDGIGAYEIKNVVPSVSDRETRVYEAQTEEEYRVTVIDYGVKRSLIAAFTERGCRVTVVPHNTTAEQILADAPDAVILSDGPGDPSDNKDEIAQAAKLIGTIPVLGIGLGHQIAALALGGTCEKLIYGHRGGNQPVREIGGSRTYITSQNHGYVVDAESLSHVGIERFANANDGTCEGMEYPAKMCMTLQFAPDTLGGGHSTAFLYDRFLGMIHKNQ